MTGIWNNNGSNSRVQYDFAIAGIPFFSANSKEYPYIRESIDYNKQQFNNSKDIGENALGNWWYRSQSSFDLGAGAKFTDIGTDPNIARRFYDSNGVDTISEAGKVTLLNKVAQCLDGIDYSTETGPQGPILPSNIKLIKTGENSTDFMMAVDKRVFVIYLTTTAEGEGYSDASLWCEVDSKIIDIVNNGSSVYVLTLTGVYEIAYGGSSLIANFPEAEGSIEDTGKLAFEKDRLIITIGGEIYQCAPVAAPTPINPTKIEWVKASSTRPSRVRYSFNKKYNWYVGQTIDSILDSSVPEFEFESAQTIYAVSSDGLQFSIQSTNAPSNTAITDLTKAADIYLTEPNLPIKLHKTTGDWQFTAIASGPTGIYFAGHNWNKSNIMFSSQGKEYINDAPQLLPPVIVAELPDDEIIYSMISYLGTYIIIGTNKGVRVAIIDSRGGLMLGPLSIETEANIPVKALAASGDFVYCSGAKAFNQSALYKLNLSKPIENNSLQFAWQKDKYINYTGSGIFSTRNITQILMVLGQVVITDSETGVYRETNNKLETGWMQTGKIRLDTIEDKVFQYLTINYSSTPYNGTFRVFYDTNESSGELSGTNNASVGTKTVMRGTADLSPVDGSYQPKPYQWIQYTFVINQATDEDLLSPTLSPEFLGYQIKANPANVKQNIIRLPLLAMNKEKGITGLEVERPVWERIKELEAAERAGSVVVYQDFGFGEERLVTIDKIQFVSTHIPESNKYSERGGILLVTVRTTDTPTDTNQL